MEFYYHDQLRWGFGFDNPNKAAALLASILPLLWIGYALAWRLKAYRLLAIGAGGAILIVGWCLLLKTYSRGGLVAALAAFVYLGWMTRAQWIHHWKRLTAAALLCAVVAGVALATGAASRSTQWIGTHEGSVENRYELWQGGLKMIADNPSGVGQGHSGDTYMQWYQPLESSARYRTLVNSHLTFVAERGLAAGAGIALVCLLGWILTGSLAREPGAVGTISTALRASLIAFAVAGIFSTVMEERRIWIVPGICLSMLSGLMLSRLFNAPFDQTLRRGSRAAAMATVITLFLCAFLMAAGVWLGRHSHLDVRLDTGAAVVTPPEAVASGTITVLVDREVLGADFGKRLRELSAKTGRPVRAVFAAKKSAGAALLLVTGAHAASIDPESARALILLCPSEVPESKAVKLLRNSTIVQVIVSEFDEDGRSDFWRRIGQEQKNVTVKQLSGVGTNVEWAWEQLIDLVDTKLSVSFSHLITPERVKIAPHTALDTPRPATPEVSAAPQISNVLNHAELVAAKLAAQAQTLSQKHDAPADISNR